MSSLFYKEIARGRQREIPITYLLLEIMEKMESEIENLDVFQALEISLGWAGVLPEGGLAEEQAVKLVERMRKMSSTAPEEKSSPEGFGKSTGKSSKRGFGSEYLRRFTSLPIAEKCLFAAGYDYNKAKELYCVLDKEVSEEVIKAAFDEKFSSLQVEFEAVVYGMGGSFGGGGSSAEEGEVIDHSVPTESASYLDAAQNFVAMQNSFRKSV